MFDPAFQLLPTLWIHFHEVSPSVPKWSPCLVHASMVLQKERTAMTQGSRQNRVAVCVAVALRLYQSFRDLVCGHGMLCGIWSCCSDTIVARLLHETAALRKHGQKANPTMSRLASTTTQVVENTAAFCLPQSGNASGRDWKAQSNWAKAQKQSISKDIIQSISKDIKLLSTHLSACACASLTWRPFWLKSSWSDITSALSR